MTIIKNTVMLNSVDVDITNRRRMALRHKLVTVWQHLVKRGLSYNFIARSDQTRALGLYPAPTLPFRSHLASQQFPQLDNIHFIRLMLQPSSEAEFS